MALVSDVELSVGVLDAELSHRVENAQFTISQRPVLFISITADGLTGYGECAALSTPLRGDPSLSDVLHQLQSMGLRRITHALSVRETTTLAPHEAATLFGSDPVSRSLAALVEMAFFDLQLKRDRQSLAQWCGATRPRVSVGGFLAIDRAMTRDVVEQRVGELIGRGIRQVRFKIQPGFDVTPVRWINAVAPDLSVCVDANGSYRIDGDDVDGIPALLGLYEAGVTHVEQPLPASNLVDHAALRTETSLRVCLDEGVSSLMAVRKILQYGAADALCVKPGRVGGILAALEILRLGREYGLDCFIGGFFETGYARAHLAALAAHEAVTLASDLSSPATYGLPAGSQFPSGLVAEMPVPQGIGIAGGNDEWITSAPIAWKTVTL